ncbi:hypothetical protein AX769_21560 (plasmid) [Frondihabitans sp. PAMC 28766]|nr:hypothetical protein AX769_21560 [Frondihabitans sp. PAMC 28766]
MIYRGLHFAKNDEDRMDHHSDQKPRFTVRAAANPGWLSTIITVGFVALVLAFIVPVGFIVLLPTMVVVAHLLYRRRAWRRELHELMSPRSISKGTRT